MSRRTFGILLALFVIFLASSGTASSPQKLEPESQVVVYYFHRSARCQTCLKMESLARYDVTVNLASEIESGDLEWQLVNFQEEGNSHFEELFELEGPTLVATQYTNGEIQHWVKLDRIWELYDDVDAFDEYVLGAVKEYLLQASVENGSEDGVSHSE